MNLAWDDLDRLHVVRKLGQIAQRRWGLGLGFVRARAEDVRIPRPEADGACRLVQSCAPGLAGCTDTAHAVGELLAVHAVSGQVPASSLAYTCHAGLKEVAVPILLDGRYLGCVIAGGFSTAGQEAEERPLATARISRLPVAAEAVAPALERHPRLSLTDVGYLTELMELVAEEAVAFLTETSRLPEEAAAAPGRYAPIIGQAPQMLELYRVLDRVVESDTTVLVQGENGTGKELVARAIHRHSARRDQRFVVQNCSALNDNLLDSELFGHRRGAFTGAVSDKPGLFEVADRGTFFLDEVGDMSPALQVKLLRVLQEGQFTRVGDTEPRQVDVRIIGATHRDLRAMVVSGEFREDLFYRINVINLVVPPLRERPLDLPVLCDHFLQRLAAGGKQRRKRLARPTLELFAAYAWPGNVRELENEIERLVVLSGEERVIAEDMVSPRIRVLAERPAPSRSLDEAVGSFERGLLGEALAQHRWNRTQAAEALGISRRNLIRKIAKYKLSPIRRRKADP